MKYIPWLFIAAAVTLFGVHLSIYQAGCITEICGRTANISLIVLSLCVGCLAAAAYYWFLPPNP